MWKIRGDRACRLMAATLLMLAHAAKAGACKCAPPPPPVDALEGADAVFAGFVVGVDEGRQPHSGDLVRYSIYVTHTWKGVLTDTVSVYSERYTPACGFPFRQGEQYLIYADFHAYKDRWGSILPSFLRTSRCTRTALLSDALADRYKLPAPAEFMSQTPLPEVNLAALIKQLEDDDPSVRRRAARAIGEIGEEMELVVPALVKLMGSKYSSDRAAAVSALEDLGPRARGAAPALRKVLRSKIENDFVRQTAERALASMTVEQ